MKRKPSDIFEGPQSTLSRAFSECCDREDAAAVNTASLQPEGLTIAKLLKAKKILEQNTRKHIDIASYRVASKKKIERFLNPHMAHETKEKLPIGVIARIGGVPVYEDASMRPDVIHVINTDGEIIGVMMI